MVCSASSSPRVDMAFYVGRLVDDCDEVARPDHVADCDLYLGDRAGLLCVHGDLHLHRLQQHQGVPFADVITLGDHDLQHAGHDLRANVLGHYYPVRLPARLCAPLAPHRTTTSHETLMPDQMR